MVHAYACMGGMRECVLFWSVSVCMHATKELNVEKKESVRISDGHQGRSEY